MQLQAIPLDRIYVDDSFNCRGVISPNEIQPLAEDIRKRGLEQPVIVCPISHLPGYDYQLVAGFRRYTAHKFLRMPTITAIIKKLTLEEAYYLNLRENVLRTNLNIMQEAKGVEHLYNLGKSEDEIATALSQTAHWVSVRLKLLTMSPEIQTLAAAGQLTSTQVKKLSTIPPAKQKEFLEEWKEAQKNPVARAEKPVDPYKRKVRTASEIEDKIMELFELLGEATFASRCLAWAAGNVSDADLSVDVEKECDARGIPYTRPVY